MLYAIKQHKSPETMLNIELIPAFEDNYIYLLTDTETGTTAIVDPGDATPVQHVLDERGLTLDYILNTHHHGDHTGGNQALKKRYGCTIIGPAADKHRIPGIDHGTKESDIVSIGDSKTKILETHGHTMGHICFWFQDDRALFCGDTLFSMSTGRLFEGTPEDMWASLTKISALPDDTMIYCAHEYTEENGEFCLTVEPNNEDLKARMDEVRQLRAQDKPTLPVSLATEKKTNAMLRAGSATRYAAIRKMKDDWD